jgi:opacity protein-like surface antigen
LAVPSLATAASAQEADFVELFDGTSTKGWTKPYDWGQVAVKEGHIQLTGEKKFFLVSEKTYKNFVLEGEVFCPKGGNSGFQFRCHYMPNKLWGYQAEVDTSDRKWAGGLYDEGRRAWLVSLKDKPEAQAAFKNGEWNKYRIEAVGDHLKIFVNGVQTVDFHDSMDAEGHIALQHHGEKGLTYKFRNVRIKVLPDSAKSE